MDVYVILGVIGLASLLFAFYLAETGKIATTLRRYTALNAFGSLLLIIYSVHIDAWIFTVLNVVWFCIATIKLIFPHHTLIPHNKRRLRRRD